MRSIYRKGAGDFSQRDSKNKNEKNPDPIHEGRYLYTDGGVFENEPLGMAKSLIDHNQEKPEDRYFLLVKPGSRKASKDPFFNQNPNLLTIALALFGAISQQAQFQDWIMDDVNSKLLTITSNDNELIGDVFSAFSGFLEEKFRAYDYNIGRENARKRLTQEKILNFDPEEQGKMPVIEWKVDERKSVIGGQILKTWDEVKLPLSKLAKVVKDEKGKRKQLEELHRLMHEVEDAKRQAICKQLKLRLDYMVDFVNEEYLDGYDNSVKKTIRNNIGKPLAKKGLGILLNIWLEKNILNP